MTPTLQVTEEMIEAGCDARFATIHESGVVAVEAIYLAMKAAEPLPQGDEVERIVSLFRAFCRGLETRAAFRWFDSSTTQAVDVFRREVTAALVRSKPDVPQGDENSIRLALEDADYLERIADEADDNNWQDWAATMRGAAAHIRAALVRSPQGDAVERTRPAPCPKCGYQDERGDSAEAYCHHTSGGVEYIVICGRCRHEGELKATPEWAVQAWNTSAALVRSKPIDRDEVERLLLQYRDDLLYPPDDDSADRRLTAISKALTAIGSQSIEGERG